MFIIIIIIVIHNKVTLLTIKSPSFNTSMENVTDSNQQAYYTVRYSTNFCSITSQLCPYWTDWQSIYSPNGFRTYYLVLKEFNVVSLLNAFISFSCFITSQLQRL